jgi:hypothetical protein
VDEFNFSMDSRDDLIKRARIPVIIPAVEAEAIVADAPPLVLNAAH